MGGFELTAPCASYILGMGTDKSSALPTELNSHPPGESRRGAFDQNTRNPRE